MANIIKIFFWACSGANSTFLESDDCQTEHSKYVGIGATIFFISVLAALSFGYAFYTVFVTSEIIQDAENQNQIFTPMYLAVGLGIFWGLIIFNLDRFLVSTLKKDRPSNDEKFFVKVKNATGTLVKRVLPRLALALVLALIISKPIEMRIFKKEIDTEIAVMQAENVKANTKKILEDKTNDSNQEINQSNDKIQKLKNEIKANTEIVLNAEKEWEKASAKRLAELNGDSSVVGKAGKGENYKIFVEQENVAKENFDRIRKNLTEENTTKEENIKNIGKIISESELESVKDATEKSVQLDGLVTRIQALSRLGQKDSVVLITNWLIFLVILLLELSPIVNKIIAPYGPYDKLVDEHEQKVFIESDKKTFLLKEELDMLNESLEARRTALKNIENDIYNGININGSGVTQDEINSIRRELVRKASKSARGNY